MLRWLAADMVTGQVFDELPSIIVSYPIRRTLSNYDATTATVQLQGAPEDWQRVTQPGAALFAAYDDTAYDDGTQPRPLPWVGFVQNRQRDESNGVTVGLTTLEGYLDRRYVGDVTYSTTQDRNAIIADLMTTNVIGGGGIACMQLDCPTSTKFPSQPLVWQDADNVTVFGRITQLCALLGGEFTIDWAWSSDGTSIVPTFHAADRIGLAAT